MAKPLFEIIVLSEFRDEKVQTDTSDLRVSHECPTCVLQAIASFYARQRAHFARAKTIKLSLVLYYEVSGTMTPVRPAAARLLYRDACALRRRQSFSAS